ncbi:MAG: Ldh family oxidoreductase, partial [Chloroflexota bacterium]
GEAIQRAHQHGIAAVATRGSNHCGAMAYYAEMALDHDMIGIATTNALPTMAPFGGAERVLGINPLAFAAPAAQETPISYDAAFSGSSHGKIRVHHQKRQRIPEGWALDEHGEPTTDPAEAIKGLLVPNGGYKGAGLAMIMGILSSMLSGAAYGTELGDMENGPRAGRDGHFFSAIKVAAFEDPARFKERVDHAIQQIHNVRLAPGYERTYAPGEQEALRAREYRQSGIPLNSETLSGVRRAALGLGMETVPESWGGG